jgi:hypothetical protein
MVLTTILCRSTSLKNSSEMVCLVELTAPAPLCFNLHPAERKYFFPLTVQTSCLSGASMAATSTGRSRPGLRT